MAENSRKRSGAVIYILAILIVVALIGIVGYFMTGRDRSSTITDSRNFTPYPTINTSVSSSADGKSHTLDVDLVLEFSDGSNIPHDVVYETMQQTVSKMDYEALKRNDSVEMIEASVKEALKDIVGDGNVENVYVGNIAIDFPGLVDNTQQPATDNSAKLKGLFKNLQD